MVFEGAFQNVVAYTTGSGEPAVYRAFSFTVDHGIVLGDPCGEMRDGAVSTCAELGVDLSNPAWSYVGSDVRYLDLTARGGTGSTRFPDNYSDVRAVRTYGSGEMTAIYGEDSGASPQYALLMPTQAEPGDPDYAGTTVYTSVQIGYNRSFSSFEEGPFYCDPGGLGGESCYAKTKTGGKSVALQDVMGIADLPSPFYKGGVYDGWWEPLYFVSVATYSGGASIKVQCRKLDPQPPPS